MGIFPSVETLLAQLLLLALLGFALIKTFWPKRSVSLPTMSTTVSTVSVAAVAVTESDADQAQRVAALEAEVARLKRAVGRLEPAAHEAAHGRR
jgi:hypothetical protein